MSYPKDATLVSLFEEQAARQGDRVAVKRGERVLTYRELNEEANRLAHALRERGLAREEVVGLHFDRTPEMIIALLAVLKAGGAYLPVDPTYPEERKSFMLTDGGVRFLLAESRENLPDFAGEVWVSGELDLKGYPRENPHPVNEARDLCYILYTSGSTGQPKGVMTTHRNVVRTMVNNGFLEVTPEDRVLQLSNYAFDGSTLEIYSALLFGAPLILLPKEEVLNVRRLAQVIREERITLTFITSSLFNTLVDWDVNALQGMRKVFFGGEQASSKHVKKALAVLGEHRLINGYGPTETTVFACTHSVDRRVEEQRTIPIGKPLSNTTCYVLDRQGRPQPIGVPGELWIGGDGVARGYLNRPELTAERFVENPLVPGERLYRSGDLVRWSPGGELEYLGRIDEQVKIRGHRIELGEIESRLLEHPSVEEAVLVARRDEAGHSFLAAYLTGQSVADADLRRHLSETLPEYMVPSSFTFLEALPLTPNGKVDKRALPEPVTRSEEQSSPATETERALARIWAEVLGRETGVNEHFFEVGGHSLKAMVLTARIHKELGKEVPLSEVFARPTIREMAAWMDDQEQRVSSEIQPVGEREHYPVSAAQRRMYTVQQLEGGA